VWCNGVVSVESLLQLLVISIARAYRGWTDAKGNEYAIACCSDGTSFVDVTTPEAPVVLGFLPTQTVPSR
jgi:hypothetical protein